MASMSAGWWAYYTLITPSYSRAWLTNWGYHALVPLSKQLLRLNFLIRETAIFNHQAKHELSSRVYSSKRWLVLVVATILRLSIVKTHICQASHPHTSHQSPAQKQLIPWRVQNIYPRHTLFIVHKYYCGAAHWLMRGINNCIFLIRPRAPNLWAWRSCRAA